MSQPSSRRLPERELARRSFAAAASTYDRVAVLQERVRQQLLRRLEEMALQPKRIVDLGCGTGAGAKALSRSHPAAEVLALDFAEPMARTARDRGQIAVAAEASRLPLPQGSVDVVFSSLALQWCRHLGPAMREARRVLRTGGVLLFATLGPQTLDELRSAWARVDEGPHVHDFLSVGEVESSMRESGLTEVRVDSCPEVMAYEKLSGLTDHLRGLGAVNAAGGRQRGLTGKGKLRGLRQAYAEFRRPDGFLPATFQVLYCRAERSPDAADTASALGGW